MDGDEWLLTAPDGRYCGSEGVKRFFRVRAKGTGRIIGDKALVRRFRRAIALG